MIGRTPEYLGKKIQAREVKLAGFGALVMPIIVLVLTGIAVSTASRESRPAQRRAARLQRDPLRPDLAREQQRLRIRGPHRQYRLLQHLGRDRHVGRPVRHHDPCPCPRRALAAKNVVPVSLGTFRTDNAMFIGLTIGVISLSAALRSSPPSSLGPIVEELSHGKFWPMGSIRPVFQHLLSLGRYV